MLAQAVYAGFSIGEISCPTKYFADASSINFKRSMIYGLGVLKVAILFRLTCLGMLSDTIYQGLRRNQKSSF